jgi:hypothetical protein
LDHTAAHDHQLSCSQTVTYCFSDVNCNSPLILTIRGSTPTPNIFSSEKIQMAEKGSELANVELQQDFKSDPHGFGP